MVFDLDMIKKVLHRLIIRDTEMLTEQDLQQVQEKR